MKRPARIIIIISLAFLLKAISSCVQPVYDFDFDFESITVSNLDNSEVYVMRSDRDTMYSAAVAFEVTISGDQFSAATGPFKNETVLPGFTPASADQPEPRYHPMQKITSISIVALEELSSSIPAGSDVTELFVAYVPYFSEMDFLYIRTDQLPSMINREFYSGEPSVTFRLFCKEDIGNSRAQFVIRATLSDDRTLAATTNMITIITAA